MWPFLFVIGDGALDVSSAVVGGIQSTLALEKPPMSSSDITLTELAESGSWKVVRIYGVVADLVPSAVRAASYSQPLQEQLRPRQHPQPPMSPNGKLTYLGEPLKFLNTPTQKATSAAWSCSHRSRWSSRLCYCWTITMCGTNTQSSILRESAAMDDRFEEWRRLFDIMQIGLPAMNYCTLFTVPYVQWSTARSS